jgi:hypothetical protein
MTASDSSDRIGFCRLGIWKRQRRGMFIAPVRKALKLRQERHLHMDMPPRWGCENFLRAQIYRQTAPLGLAYKIRHGQGFINGTS